MSGFPGKKAKRDNLNIISTSSKLSFENRKNIHCEYRRFREYLRSRDLEDEEVALNFLIITQVNYTQ